MLGGNEWRPSDGLAGGAKLLAISSFALLVASLTLSTPSATASPGWELVLDRPTPSFAGIDFVSNSEGWLVAGAGLLHTTDGGATWEEAASLTGVDVDFADADHGWLVGYNGVIYGTSDGGGTWSQQASGTSVHLSDVFAISAQEAWAVGSGSGFGDTGLSIPPPSVFLHTTDGGVTWQQIETPPGSWFREITFIGQQGWALGSRCSEPLTDSYCPGGRMSATTSALLRTTDNGETWALLDADGFGDGVRDLVFVNETQGWAIGTTCGPEQCRSVLLQTADGGLTWQQHPWPLGSFYALAFRDKLTGWAIGDDCEGQTCSLLLFSTGDGGNGWRIQTVGPSHGRPLSLYVTDTAFYLTGYGVALRSTDDGASWQPMEHPALDLRRIEFGDRQVGYAINADGAMLRTDDGGRNWRRVGPEGDSISVLQLEFLSADHGFAAIDDCTEAECTLSIRRTDDGGETWAATYRAPAGFSAFPIAFQFADADHGWFSFGRGFFLTQDGGTKWEQHPLGELGSSVIDADLADKDHAWATVIDYSEPGLPTTHLLRSLDGGRTWKVLQSSPGKTIGLVDFVDRDHGWYAMMACEPDCRTLVFATQDGGETWQETDLGPRTFIRDLAFVDPLNGWLYVNRCDERCTYEVLHTADGGRTWASQTALEFDAGFFEFIDVETGWLLVFPGRLFGIGGGPPHRTLLYHTADAGGGPIGEATPEIKFPDVGAGTSEGGIGAVPLAALTLGVLGAALGAAALGLHRRRDS